MEETRNTTTPCSSLDNGTTICIMPYTSHPALSEPVRYPTNSQTVATYDIMSGLTVLPDFAEMPRGYRTDSTSSPVSGTQIFDQAGHSLAYSDPNYCHTNVDTPLTHNHPNIDIKGRNPHQHTESVVNTTEITERNAEPATKRRRTNSENYKRHPKPPYTYAAMLIMAIENSPNKRLTLTGIHAALKGFFEFFHGQYTGWKDSIRHNLSNSICFYKEKGPPEGVKSGKFSFFWRVDLSKVAPETFLCQSNQIAREGDYEKELHQQLGLPRPVLPAATHGDRCGTSNHSHTAYKIEQPATVNDTHSPEVSTTATTPAYRLWNPCENTPVTVKVEQQHATKSNNLIKMTLPMKSSSNSNVATDSPEQLRMSDLAHAKRQNIKREPMKSGICETPTNIEQPTSIVTRKRHIHREMNELYTYVASTEHTSSADQAVNNLSLLCSVAQPRELTSKVDNQSEAHLAPPCFHTHTACAYAFPPSSSTSASVCKTEPRVNSPIIQDQMAQSCMLDNYLGYNGYYAVNHTVDGLTPHAPYAPLLKRPKTESHSSTPYGQK